MISEKEIYNWLQNEAKASQELESHIAVLRDDFRELLEEVLRLRKESEVINAQLKTFRAWLKEAGLE
jgi:SpoVK/Ycf46/Vps4 family AAA+-type ATPase